MDCYVLAYPETVVVPAFGPLNRQHRRTTYHYLNYLQKNTLLCILFVPHIVLSQTIAVAWVVGAAEGGIVDEAVGGAEGGTEGAVVGGAEGDTEGSVVGAAVAVLTKS
jgi:hypothetical protein